MAEASVVDLKELIDGQRLGTPAIMFLVIAILILVSDGFDIAAIGYVGPELVKQWHITPRDLVPVFSAGIFGLLFGAPLIGFLGDRIGRKQTILLGLVLFGGMSLLTMAATSLTELVALRFFTGLGLGGVIPNLIALTAEVAPKRWRARFIVIVNFGVPAGISIPGLVAASLVPQHGWQTLMLVGGLLPLGVAVLVFFLLPESMKFLLQRGGRDDQIRRLAARLRPDLALAHDARFAIADDLHQSASASPARLFAGGLRVMTPMLWIALAANQMANFFSLTWLPTLLQSAGSSTAEAGVRASLFSLGGMLGGLCLTFLMDRIGAVPLIVLFAAGAPLVAGIGVAGLSPELSMLIIAGAGFCVTGINFGMGATLGMIYPTPVRSLGTGWAQSFGRLGSLAAPIVGGWLIGLQVSLQELLFAPAIVLGLGGVAFCVFAVMYVRRLGGLQLDELAPQPAMAPARHFDLAAKD